MPIGFWFPAIGFYGMFYLILQIACKKKENSEKDGSVSHFLRSEIFDLFGFTVSKTGKIPGFTS